MSSSSLLYRKAAPPMDLVTKSGGFVEGLRRNDLDKVKVRLLGINKTDQEAKEEEEVQGVVGIHGINGMGGLGKSTLAQQIARDTGVRRHFGEDAIFWINASVQNLEEEFDNLIHDIWRLRGKDSANDDLKTISKEKRFKNAIDGVHQRILIVIDDVWDAVKVKKIIPDASKLPKGSAVLIRTSGTGNSDKTGNSRF